MSLSGFLTGKTWEQKDFPADLCTIPNEREPEVLDSKETFLCLLEDPQFEKQAYLRVLMPYTCVDPDTKEVLYGWTDGRNVFDHFEKSIHGDREVVTAWTPFTEG